MTTLEAVLLQMQSYTDTNGNSYPRKADLLPAKNATICEIDLNTRKITSPEVLSVEFDHNSEVIYFKCARYFDNMDLASAVCVIEYVNADGDAGLYWVPYIDTTHYDVEVDENGVETKIDYMIIPWAVNGLATAKAGTLQFGVKFYRIASDKTMVYCLRTQPAKGQILHGLDLGYELEFDENGRQIQKTDSIESLALSANELDRIFQQIQDAESNATVYWTDV